MVTLVIAVTAGAGVWLLRNKDPIPQAIRQQANFSLYYPAGIPIDKGSIQLTNGKLLSYTVHYQGSVIYITIQSKPQYFDFASFDKGIKSSTVVTTPYGNATIGTLGGRMIGDLPAIDSWVLLSSQTKTPTASLADILRQLKKD